jgi:hypothetical protein
VTATTKPCEACGGRGTVPRDPADPLARYSEGICVACGGGGAVPYVPPRHIPESVVDAPAPEGVYIAVCRLL